MRYYLIGSACFGVALVFYKYGHAAVAATFYAAGILFGLVAIRKDVAR